MANIDKKLLEILERIDPSVRRERLTAQKADLEQRFVDAYATLESQDRLVERHRASVGGKPTAMQQAILEQATENLRLQRLLVEHLGAEVELVNGQLDEIQKAGLPKPKLEPVKD